MVQIKSGFFTSFIAKEAEKGKKAGAAAAASSNVVTSAMTSNQATTRKDSIAPSSAHESPVDSGRGSVVSSVAQNEVVQSEFKEVDLEE